MVKVDLSSTLQALVERQARALQRYADLDAALQQHDTLSIVIDGDRVGVAGDGGTLMASVTIHGSVLDAVARVLGVE
jgi:hypothetical protein